MGMDRLQFLLATMNVPHMRLNDMGWLSRNLRINNSHNPHIEEAMELVTQKLMERNKSRIQHYKCPKCKSTKTLLAEPSMSTGEFHQSLPDSIICGVRGCKKLSDKINELCVVDVGYHTDQYYIDNEYGMIVCSRHMDQYEERPDLGPFKWERLFE